MALMLWVNHLTLGWTAFVELQQSQKLLWIIDTAPFFLGLAFSVAGRREDSFIQIKNLLEQTVTDRTAELEKTNQNLESEIEDRHNYESRLKATAEDLQLITEVARAISLEQNVENLLPLITRMVSERFGFYHVGIFMLDETRKYAVLKASNSQEGQRMMERGHRLEVGQVGIVGNVAASGLTRIASEVGEDDVFFNNPDLPETRSEISLPLMVRNQIIGVIDVQSKQSHSFSSERANTLAILADLMAIAIENSRLFTETQEALAEAQEFSVKSSTRAWEKVAREQHIGYLHTTNGDKKLTEPIQWEEARQAVKNGEMVIISPENGTTHEAALAIPLLIHDKTIGVLDIRSANPDRLWLKEEINIIQAIADRVGLALENAQLFEETTGRANRERIVSEITTRLRSTSDPEIMLQTALDELKHALGANDIQIRPYSRPPADQNAGQQLDPIKNKTIHPTEVA
jgi:GAF domain-containing protein